MKKFMLFFSVLLSVLQIISLAGFSQTLIERKIYSANVNKTVDVKVWLPRNFSVSNKYPVIYEMVYDHSSFIAGTVASFYEIPPCIVVQAQIVVGQSYYSSPQLKDDDLRYYQFLKNELIPLVEKEYSASKFRIALGLSQGADYSNYIFRNNPELFSAFGIFATERQINYELDYTDFAKKITDSMSYFIATGNDMAERVDFAKTLYKQISQNNIIRLKMYHYERSDHSYVMLDALPDALRFIFQDYINLRKPNNENAYQYFKNLYIELINKYGYEPNINGFTANYLDIITETKEVTGILQLVKEFYVKFGAIDLYNIGYTLANITKYKDAENVLKLCIQKLFTGRSSINLDAPYRTLALRVYDAQGNTDLAYKTLEEGHEKIKATNINLLYNIGKYAIEKKYKVQDGIEALILFKDNQAKFESSFIKPADELNTLIAKGYLLLKKNKESKIYLEEALKENSKNDEAVQLLKSLDE